MLSILIPTLDRPAFLARTLRYLREQGFHGPVLVGDGSMNVGGLKACTEYNGTWLDCRGITQQATLGKLADAVDTPYAVYCGDDDFLIPASLAACCAALDKQSDYQSARGHGMVINANGVRALPFMLEPYRQAELSEISPMRRVLGCLRSYAVSLFSVHRIDTWRAMFSASRSMRDKWMGAEIAPCVISAARGRTLVLDIPYLARQIHQGRYGGEMGEAWFTSPEVQADARLLIDQVCFLPAHRREVWRALYDYMVGYQQPQARVPRRFWQAQKVLGAPWFRPIDAAICPSLDF